MLMHIRIRKRIKKRPNIKILHNITLDLINDLKNDNEQSLYMYNLKEIIHGILMRSP